MTKTIMKMGMQEMVFAPNVHQIIKIDLCKEMVSAISFLMEKCMLHTDKVIGEEY